MPYKTHKYKRFKSKRSYDKYEAYMDMHNIPHTRHETVRIAGNIYHPKRSIKRR